MSRRDAFTAKEAAFYCDLSREMIDYLCRHDIVLPDMPKQRGRGRRRQFSFETLLVLRAVRLLLEQGIEVKRLKSTISTLSKELTAVTAQNVKRYVVVSGGQAFVQTDDPHAKTMDGQFVFRFVLNIEALGEEVRRKIAK
jgi:DNA-binding transcriptional MerR regulator